MKQSINPIRLLGLLLGVLSLLSPGFSSAQSVWITAGDGNWDDIANWLGGLPTLTSAVTITNASTKTITITATTPVENLAARRMDLSAPAGSTNTLRLDNIGTTAFVVTNTLSIEAGGRMEILNSSLTVDGVSGGSFNMWAGELQLNGGTIVTTNGAVLRIGRAGVGLMEITGGQLLVGTNLSVGSFLGSDGTLTVLNGLAQVDGQLTVADDLGSVGRVHIAGGALVSTNLTASVGDDGNGTLAVTAGSVTMSGISVGRTGIGLTVLTGGELTVGADMVVAQFAGSEGVLTLSNGLAQVGGQVTVGDNLGAIGRINVAGGRFIATNETFTARIGDDGEGTMTVTSGSVFLDSVSVGRSAGSVGRLFVHGGTVESGSLSIGRFAGSQGTLEVTGGALNLEPSSLYIGREGAGNAVISNGTVRAARTFVAATSGATGSLQLRGGELITGELVATNSAGQIEFATGRLETKSSTVVNGAAFIVGNGLQSATLHLDGGTHTFANGLTIASNSTLAGTGTINGGAVVQAGGTLSPGASIGTLTVNGPLNLAGNTIMEVNKTGVVLTNDLVAGLSTVNCNGTLTVTASGDSLAANNTFKLLDATAFAGSFATINLPALPGCLTWDTSMLMVDGTIQVVACSTPSQLTVIGQVELQSYIGTSRTVTFVATGGVSNKTWTVSLNFAGANPKLAVYLLEDAPPGTTAISAKTAFNLRRKLPVTFSNNQASANFTGATRLLGGDLNGSNGVSSSDYSILKARWLTTDPAADINGSGGVTSSDYSILKANWLTQGDPL